MSRFYVGQRVRVVRIDASPSANGYGKAMAMLGKEGIVNITNCRDEFTKETGMIGVTINGDPDWCFSEHELEPITDSNTLVSWESMRDLWVPDHMRTKA